MSGQALNQKKKRKKSAASLMESRPQSRVSVYRSMERTAKQESSPPIGWGVYIESGKPLPMAGEPVYEERRSWQPWSPPGIEKVSILRHEKGKIKSIPKAGMACGSGVHDTLFYK